MVVGVSVCVCGGGYEIKVPLSLSVLLKPITHCQISTPSQQDTLVLLGDGSLGIMGKIARRNKLVLPVRSVSSRGNERRPCVFKTPSRRGEE